MTEYRKGKFTMDGLEGKVFTGYHPVEFFAVTRPLFTADQVQVIVEAHRAFWLEANGQPDLLPYSCGYDKATDEFWFNGAPDEPHNPEQVSGDRGKEIVINEDGDRLHVYEIGAEGDWTWRNAQKRFKVWVKVMQSVIVEAETVADANEIALDMSDSDREWESQEVDEVYTCNEEGEAISEDVDEPEDNTDR